MNVKAYLSKGKPLLFDGAMGTVYSMLPDSEKMPCEVANLERAEDIRAIHRRYLDAGCQAIKTNTFSVGQYVAQGNTDLAFRVIQAACENARQAVGERDAFIFADLGPAPLNGVMLPAENYILQSKLFMQQGLNCFLLETLPNFEGVAAFAEWLKRQCPDAFLIVSFAVGPDEFTREGCPGREMFALARKNKYIDAVGLNCFTGPYHIHKLLCSLDMTNTCVSAMPNAGYPSVLGRRAIYGGSPDYFAQQMEKLLNVGAMIIGGCCGTTPEHIQALRTLLDDYVADQPEQVTGTRLTAKNAENRLWNKIEQGKRIIAVEYDPPSHDDVSAYLEGVRSLHAVGVDAVTIADCPVGVSRVDSSLLACKLRRELNVDPIPHMTCRDRNMNAIKALLLGLSTEGVHNVLLVTGDPLPQEVRDEVKSVFNFNSRKLAKYVGSLAVDSLSTPFHMYGALNVNAPNFASQLQLALEKEQNGIDGFMTQPILSPEAMENLKRARDVLKGKIFGGIYPIVSYRNACFMNNEIAGIHVSPEICEKYKDTTREQAEAIAVELSVQIARDIEPYTDGLYIMTPFNRVELVCKIIRELHGSNP